MKKQKLYYSLKPLIPRWMQLYLRRKMVLRKRILCRDTWPIDEKAGSPPPAWNGWPQNKKFALILTHDVETAKGLENCRQLIGLEERLGFQSSFGFVTERYSVSSELRQDIIKRGFEVVVHGLYHDGKYYNSWEIFQTRAKMINRYLREWSCAGFRSPSMHHNLDWIHELDIDYDSSTFDTDPFEPQPDGVQTIFPFYVKHDGKEKGYVELPYTLPQDFTLFVLMGESDISIWKRKLDWVVERGGMALLITHPDYMDFGIKGNSHWEYPARYYEDFLQYVKVHYKGLYWNVLPKDIARFWKENFS